MYRKAWPGLLAGAAGIALWIGSWLAASIVLRAVLSAAAVVCIVLIVCRYQKSVASKPKRYKNVREMSTEQALKESFIQALSMRRHDYMNDIQLLMGYLQLKKYDKLKDFVEILKDKATQESYMFRWGNPDLIVHMYTFGVLSRKLQVTVETEEDVQLHKLAVDNAYVAARMIDMTKIFERIAVTGQLDNQLTIAVYVDQEQLCSVYEYEGRFDSEDLHRTMRGFLDQQDTQLGTKIQWEEHEDWLTVTLRFPLAEVNVQAVL